MSLELKNGIIVFVSNGLGVPHNLMIFDGYTQNRISCCLVMFSHLVTVFLVSFCGICCEGAFPP